MLFSTHISPTILVIISGIWQELEIKILHLFDLVKPHVKGTLVFPLDKLDCKCFPQRYAAQAYNKHGNETHYSTNG